LENKNAKKSVCLRFKMMIASFNKWLAILKLVWCACPSATIITSVLTLVIGPLSALYLYSWKKVIDGVELWLQADVANGRQMVLFFLGVACVIMLVQFGLERFQRFMQQLLRLRLTYYTQEKILNQATSLDMVFFEMPSFYDKLSRAEQGAGSRPYIILSAFLNTTKQCVTLCSYMIVLFTLSFWTLPYLILVTMPDLFVQTRFGRLWWSMLFSRTPEERRMEYYQHLLASRPEAKEIRLFGLANYFMSRWREVFLLFYHQERRLSARRNLVEFGIISIQTLAGMVFYAFVIYRTITDPIVSIGSLIMYTQAMDRSVRSMSRAFRSLGILYENSLYMDGLFDYLSLRPSICAPDKPVAVPAVIQQGIRFESVSFRYPGNTEDVLHDISFEIRVGERVAIVGENGAGKTTLVKLLARLYDPQCGRITIDGIDLRKMEPNDWYRQIGIIFQDFTRYAVTARENIGFGQLAYVKDMTRIRTAADFSGASECIERLNNGWDTILGKTFDDGQDLSIGEWQKVALARAFLRDANILVLDEPTASLDPKREYEIFDNFNEITKGKTTILISHRFSTVRMVDRIFVIEKGYMVEHGTHDELLAVDNRYAELFNRQASAYR
jgi:ATP-binding cassette subfamily B protein